MSIRSVSLSSILDDRRSESIMNVSKIQTFPAQYYRLLVNSVRTGGESVQFSEFRLQQNSTWLTGAAYINLIGQSPLNEGPQRAGDGNTSTKWLNFQGANSVLEIIYPSPVTVTDYTWWTANDNIGRDMTSWILLSSKNGNNWTTISNVVDFVPTTSRLTNVGVFYVQS